MFEIFEKFLKDQHISCVEKNVSMKKLTTIQCGGNVDYLASPDAIYELTQIFECISKNDIPYKILGNGSNILVSDLGCNGIVITLKNMPPTIEIHNEKIHVAAQTEQAYLQKKCILEGVNGLEFLSGIPGTIGGLIAMNAGSFGHEIADVLDSIHIIIPSGKKIELKTDHIDFSYRKINLAFEHYIITKGIFNVERNTMMKVKETYLSYLQRRKSKNLWQMSTFGSTFKNGKDFYAGELLEKCGCKGYCIGDAMVSETHANFIINNGNATSKDIYLLIKKMKEEVKKKFDKDLELEVKLWGDFSYAEN